MGRTVTYFQNYKAKQPIHRSVEVALDRIRTGAIKDKIEQLRSMTDKKEAKRFKTETLPCICFAGKFTERNDTGLEEHSGLAILDFDHIDPVAYKEELKKFNWVYSAFVSPSGDGLKVVATIPAEKEKHRGYFKGIQQELSHLTGFDPTSINPSRICFESYDPEIYINPFAVPFTNYVAEDKPAERKSDFTPALISDFRKLAVAVDMVLEAPEGSKHAELLKASKLCGGWIQSGVLDETDAILALERAISTRNIDDFAGAQKTIRDGISYGKNHPLQRDGISLTDNDFSFLSSQNAEQDYLDAVRNQTLPQGLSTGYENLDRHYRFKQGNFVIINGHDNVGKSSFLWYLAVLSNVMHGWKWVFFCAENPEGQVRKNLMQFKAAKGLHEMNDVEYEHTLRWAYENFTLIRSEEMLNCEQLLKMTQKILNQKQHHAVLIDPYNALDLDIENTKLSSHEYHYRVTAMMRSFCKKNDVSIYLNCHAVTEALRRTHKDGPYAGFPMAPNKADTEGGGKFSNRADDFITIHRYTQHASDYNLTEIHVRKIKETETGGRPTLKDDPIKFKMEKGIYGFFNPENGYNPLSNEQAKQARAQSQIRKLVFRDEEEKRERDELSEDDVEVMQTKEIPF